MRQRWQILISHGVVFALGMLALGRLALPLNEGPWEIKLSITWSLALVPALVLGVASGIFQGIFLGFRLFWPTLLPMVPAAAVALWFDGLYVAPALFGSEPEQPEPALFIAAVTGWTLHLVVALLTALGVGYVAARLVDARRDERADREATDW